MRQCMLGLTTTTKYDNKTLNVYRVNVFTLAIHSYTQQKR